MTDDNNNVISGSEGAFGCTLRGLCDRIIALDVAYDDVAEQLEDLAYHEFGSGDPDDAVKELERVAHFYEGMRNKSEEIARDLAGIYLLIGQVYQYADMFERSIDWINKSIFVDDMYSVSYHSLAQSYHRIGDDDMAIKCLEQEIRVAPGNYYTYLLLADFYEKCGRPGALEDVLKLLLERDPGNIQGLHRLIRYYEGASPDLDVELLRRRLLDRQGGYSRIETVIRAYHLFKMGRGDEAIDFLTSWSAGAPDVSIAHLAKAYIYGQTHRFSQKRLELSLFKRKNHSRDDVIAIKLDEFASVFGHDAAEYLQRGLRVAVVVD